MKLRRSLPATVSYFVYALFALTLCLCQPQQTLAQWTTADGNGNINNTNTNNVGVGTTTPNYKLDVSNLVDKGQIRFGLGALDSGGFLFSNAPSHAVFSGGTSWNGGWFAKAISASLIMANNGSLVFFANNGLTSGSSYVPTERMRIDPSGFIGIGTQLPAFDGNTTKYFTLDGGTNVFGSYGVGGNISSTSAILGQFAFFNSNLGVGEKRNATIAGWNDGATNSGALTFYTANAGTLGERLRIDKTGKIGIGTSVPAYQLDLVNSSQWVARFKKTDSTNGGIIVEAASGFSPNVALSVNGTIKWYMNSNSGSSDSLQFWESTGLNARLSLTQSGSLGIGILAPNFKLDVQGGAINASGGLCMNGDCRASWSAVGGGGGTITGVTAGTGISGGGTTGSVTLTNSDPGSSQNIFKNIANSAGTTQFSAASNNDAVRFAGAGGTTVSFDAATKKVTIDGSTSSLSAANVTAGQFGAGNYTFPGNVTVNGNIAAKYQDLAEWVPSTEQITAGTVVVLDATKDNHVISSTQAYDTRVAGVISAQPGIALGEGGDNKSLVATTGRVLVKVDASRAPVHVGDLLVTSDIPGVAMKSEPVNVNGIQMHRPGTIVGKALQSLEKGSGKILVLLSLQ